jgi:hypothetical protein
VTYIPPDWYATALQSNTLPFLDLDLGAEQAVSSFNPISVVVTSQSLLREEGGK